MIFFSFWLTSLCMTVSRCGQEMESWSNEAHKSTVRTRDTIWGWSGSQHSHDVLWKSWGQSQDQCSVWWEEDPRESGGQHSTDMFWRQWEQIPQITIVHLLSGLSGLYFLTFQNLVTYITLFEPDIDLVRWKELVLLCSRGRKWGSDGTK